MATVTKYELLKTEGSWKDRLNYVLLLSDKTDLQNYLKQSSCYDGIKMLVFLSKSTKNTTNLLEIFKTDTFPIIQRTIAAKNWLKLQTDEKQICEFIIETINDRNISS